MPCLKTKQLVKVLLIQLHTPDALLMVNDGVQSKRGSYLCVPVGLPNSHVEKKSTAPDVRVKNMFILNLCILYCLAFLKQIFKFC